jgi:DNA-binding CsgD family transcriptional regulator
LIRACEWVRDYERAAEWCRYMRELAQKWRLLLYFSYCRVHYACILIWRGEWAEAETTLLAATEDLFATRPAEAGEGIVRLADLRRRQGRFDEAEVLLAQAEEHPFRMQGWHFALLVRGMLAFDRGDMPAAVELTTRFLENIPRQNCTQCLEALELLVPAHIACDDLPKARAAFLNLQKVAERAATEPARASTDLAAGHIALAENEPEVALRHFENAYDRYMRCGAPFDAALAQFVAAQTLLALGRKENATHYAQNAHKTLARLGATHIAGQVQAFLDNRPGTGATTEKVNSDLTEHTNAHDLTEREIEVLQLIALGKSNQAIADDLVLSVRTVERHISNIYSKIDVQGKAARAAATKYAFKQGIAVQD